MSELVHQVDKAPLLSLVYMWSAKAVVHQCSYVSTIRM